MTATTQPLKHPRRRDGFVIGFFLHAMFLMIRYAPWALRATRTMWTQVGWRVSPPVKSALLLNAARVLGPTSTRAQHSRFARDVLDSFCRFVEEFGRYKGAPRDRWLDRVSTVEGMDRYREARRSRRGAVFATAHLGSFEVGLADLSRHESRIHVVFQRDDHSHFERARSEVRRRWGVEEAPIEEGWPMWLRLRDALRRDEVVMMQADRVMPGQRGVVVPFMHGHIRVPTGPVRLASLTGSPIIPVFGLREADGRIRLVIEEPIDAGSTPAQSEAALRKLAAVIEKHVREQPHQWLVVQPAFIEDQPARRA